MHFSIPEYRELQDTQYGSSFVVYKVFINGVFHCEVRYSELYALNDNLKQAYGAQNLPKFPPKKLFALSKSQLEERLICLEKYLQSVSQNKELGCSPILRKFLFSAQQKCFSKWHDETDLAVFLLNGTQVILKVTFADSTENILQKVCDQLRVPQELVHNFALFIQRQEENGETHLIHWLQDYECPMVTLNNFPGQNKIIIRKSYWDPGIDLKLMSDRTTLNLFYAQTVSDVEKGWIVADQDTKKQLATLQARGEKREYLEITRSLKYYGYLKFDECTCDYPEPGTETIISIGQKDLIFSPKSPGVTDRETKFRITRIRCWKISPLSEFNKEVQLSFEYLIEVNRLQWITIISEYVFLLSACLQSTVDELMSKKNGNFPHKNVSSDGCSKINTNNSIASNQTSTLSKKPPMRSKPKSFGSKSTGSKHFIPLLENDSFENIGDDDL